MTGHVQCRMGSEVKHFGGRQVPVFCVTIRKEKGIQDKGPEVTS